MKVTRIIADLAGTEKIESMHISEAIGLYNAECVVLIV